MIEYQNTGKIENRLDGTTWYDQDYVDNLQQENNQLKKDINRILENSYTEEQLDFAVNEVKEQVKAEQQLTDMLYNNIDKLRVKNYELCKENKQLKEKINKALKMVSNQKYLHIERLAKIKDILGDKE